MLIRQFPFPSRGMNCGELVLRLDSTLGHYMHHLRFRNKQELVSTGQKRRQVKLLDTVELDQNQFFNCWFRRTIRPWIVLDATQERV